MANPSKNNQPQTPRGINKKLDLLDQKVDSLYKDIYISRPDNRRNMEKVIDRLDNSLDQLQGTDSSIAGMTEMIKRLNNYGNTNSAKMMSDMYDLFNDQSLLGNLFHNTEIHRFISAQNYTYDTMCKYFPKLQDALEITRDNVLSADSFSKKFLNPKSVKTSATEARIFTSNTEKIEKRYDMSEFLDDTYMRVSKYGEDFVYIVPYTVAFQRMVERGRKRNTSGFHPG